MKIILLERVAKLGQMGEVVKVRDGFARNYLLPQGKALRATKVNQQRFDTERAQLEARNLERKSEAEGVAKTLDGQSFTIIRQAGETGQLYGSVSTRDIADVMTEGGFSSARSQVRLDRPIKTIGLHDVTVVLHPEVEISISLNIARSADEAERQARGEDLTGREQDIFEFEEDEDEDEDAEGGDADGETSDASEDAGEEASEDEAL
jgi:large subunit ribosomal protein L9